MAFRRQFFAWCLASNAALWSAEFTAHEAASIAGKPAVSRKIDLGGGHSAKLFLEVTSKGSGHLSVKNIIVQVYDDHDDGLTFVDGLLQIDATDVDADGCKDLVLAGVATISGDKESDPVTHLPIACVYLFRPSSDSFELVYRNAPKRCGIGSTWADAVGSEREHMYVSRAIRMAPTFKAYEARIATRALIFVDDAIDDGFIVGVCENQNDHVVRGMTVKIMADGRVYRQDPNDAARDETWILDFDPTR